MPRLKRRARQIEPPPERPQHSSGEAPEQMYRRLLNYLDLLRDWERRSGLRVWDTGEVVSAAEYRRRCQQRWRRGATN